MVITRIIGGLGNQMFQYAAGKSLAIKTNQQLKLDISSFQDYILRPFELDYFNISYKLATDDEVHSHTLEAHPLLGRISRLLLKKDIFANPLHYRERFFGYDAELLKIKKSIYLSGYWQSERYFADNSEVIREEFTFKGLMSQRNLEIANRIQSTNSVSLHIRRGDYVNNRNAHAFHGLCTLEYYDKAINYISSRLGFAHYYIFSDDIDWAKKYMRIPRPHTFIGHNYGAESYNDMRLMSICKHHIIANSSFSWWGAWLNPSNDKIVVAPRRWFKSDKHCTTDLYCPGWIVL